MLHVKTALGTINSLNFSTLNQRHKLFIIGLSVDHVRGPKFGLLRTKEEVACKNHVQFWFLQCLDAFLSNQSLIIRR